MCSGNNFAVMVNEDITMKVRANAWNTRMPKEAQKKAELLGITVSSLSKIKIHFPFHYEPKTKCCCGRNEKANEKG